MADGAVGLECGRGGKFCSLRDEVGVGFLGEGGGEVEGEESGCAGVCEEGGEEAVEGAALSVWGGSVCW